MPLDSLTAGSQNKNWLPAVTMYAKACVHIIENFDNIGKG